MELRRNCVDTAALTEGKDRLPTSDVGVPSTPPLGSTVRSADDPSRHPLGSALRAPPKAADVNTRRRRASSGPVVAARLQQSRGRPYIRIACETTDHANWWVLAVEELGLGLAGRAFFLSSDGPARDHARRSRWSTTSGVGSPNLTSLPGTTNRLELRSTVGRCCTNLRLARTIPTDGILTCRCDMTLVGRGRSSD